VIIIQKEEEKENEEESFLDSLEDAVCSVCNKTITDENDYFYCSLCGQVLCDQHTNIVNNEIFCKGCYEKETNFGNKPILEHCENYDPVLRKCKITGYNRDLRIEAYTFCTDYFKDCYIRSGYKLKENEYTYGYIENDVAIEGKVFVNNVGTKFVCIDHNHIICPKCNTGLHIISFQFGIICPSCHRQIH